MDGLHPTPGFGQFLSSALGRGPQLQQQPHALSPSSGVLSDTQVVNFIGDLVNTWEFGKLLSK